tara:strand:- start:3337 stop:3510 length:174 start_codon:yes stop_codon:yes gene_type:complete
MKIRFTPLDDITVRELAIIVANCPANEIVGIEEGQWADMPKVLKRHFVEQPETKGAK